MRVLISCPYSSNVWGVVQADDVASSSLVTRLQEPHVDLVKRTVQHHQDWPTELVASPDGLWGALLRMRSVLSV